MRRIDNIPESPQTVYIWGRGTQSVMILQSIFLANPEVPFIYRILYKPLKLAYIRRNVGQTYPTHRANIWRVYYINLCGRREAHFIY